MNLAICAKRFVAKEPGYFTETEMVQKAHINSEKLREMMARKEALFTSDNEPVENGCEKFESLNKVIEKIRIYGRKAFAGDPVRSLAYTVK